MKWRVDFADGGSYTVETNENASSLEAAKVSSRNYDRDKAKHVRVLRAVRT